MKKRNGKRGFISEKAYFCPICGRDGGGPCRCPPRVLGAIDSANTRALDNEDSPSDDPFLQPSIGERLKDGFEMMEAMGIEFHVT